MSIESIAISVIVCGVLALGLFFVLARRVMRLFVRVALVGVIVLMIVIGGALLWRRGAGVGTIQQRDNRTPAARRNTPAH